MVRRTITVDPEVEKFINMARGLLLLKANVDLDFTRFINALAKLGAYRFAKGDLSEDEVKLFLSALSGEGLKALPDEAYDRLLKQIEVLMGRIAQALAERERRWDSRP